MKKNYRSILSIGLLAVLIGSLVFVLTGCGFLTSSPTAKIDMDPESPLSVDEDVTFTGDSSEASTEDGEITSYDWTFPTEFDRGSPLGNAVQTGSFSSADTYTVSLEVEDDEGKTDSASIEVEVS
ncbi:PKD domain-containing protein [Candidatus Bipolaricaulota bacterium]|nr:PKD domain-containing protein [Candidatus Bipolaricaulota bacterium]